MQNHSFLGTGWSFPPTFSRAGYKLDMTSDLNNINQSINLLFRTPQGSRSVMPDFGSDLYKYVFQKMNASLKAEIIQSVKTTILKYEPRIKVESVDLLVFDNHRVEVTIGYIVKQTNSQHSYIYPFYLNEGTDLQNNV